MQATEPLLLQLLDKEIAAADAKDSDAALLPAYATKQKILHNFVPALQSSRPTAASNAAQHCPKPHTRSTARAA